MSNENEFVRFFLVIRKNYLRLPPSVRFLKKYPRQAPYFAFLQVAMEDNDGNILRRLLRDNSTRYIAHWERARKHDEASFRSLWNKARAIRGGNLSHRAYMSSDDFAKGLRQYLAHAEKAGGPSALIDKNDWRNTWNNFRGVHWFGDLAKFDYLSRICLLSLCECPNAIPHTGKGPLKGLKMIYGEDATLMVQGKRLLQLLLKQTNDPKVVFTLEDTLCLMHFPRVKNEFRAYFTNHNLRSLLTKYLQEYGNGRGCYGRPRLPCFTKLR